MPRMRQHLDREGKKAVLRYLTIEADQTDLSSKGDKVFHELLHSYTWDELMQEVEQETEVGRRYVRSILRAAAAGKRSVDDYLGLVARSD